MRKDRRVIKAVSGLVVRDQLWLATLETRSFSFMTCGSFRAHAVVLMQRAWKAHQRRTGAEASWDEMYASVVVQPLSPGGVWLDNEPLDLLESEE